MINVNTNFKNYFEALGRSVETRVNIAGTNYDESKIISLKTAMSLFGGQYPSVGGASSEEIDLEIIPSGNIPKMAKITVSVRVHNGNNVSDWLQKGVYYIDTRDTDPETGLVTIHGYDAMLKAEQTFVDATIHSTTYGLWKCTNTLGTATSVTAYIDSSITQEFQTSDRTFTVPQVNDYVYFADGVLRTITRVTRSGTRVTLNLSSTVTLPTAYPMPCILAVYKATNKMGVGVDARGLEYLYGLTVNIPNYGEAAYSIREVISFMGALSATNAYITNDEKLNFKPLNVTDTYNLGQKTQRLTVGRAKETISKVRLIVSDSIEYSAGTGTNEIIINCPFGTQAIANSLYSSLSAVPAYKPFEAENALLPPWMEIGDNITIDGTTYLMIDRTTNYDALFTSDIAAPESGDVDHEYSISLTKNNDVKRAVWDATQPIREEVATKSTTYASISVPSNPSNGDLWYNMGNIAPYQYGKWYRYSSDTETWTELTDEQINSKGTVYSQAIEPVSPNKGDLWFTLNYHGTTYEPNEWYWFSDTQGWVLLKDATATTAMQIALEKSTTYASVSPPTTPYEGDLWYSMGNVSPYKYGKWYRYNGSSWVEITDSEINTLGRTFSQAIEPSDKRQGDLWFTLNYSGSTYQKNQWYFYNGSRWVLLEDATAVSAAQMAQAANNKVTSWSYNGGAYMDGTMLMIGTVKASTLEGGEIKILNTDEDTVGSLYTDSATTADYALRISGSGALSVSTQTGDLFLQSHQSGSASNRSFIQLQDGQIMVGNIPNSIFPDNNSRDFGKTANRWNNGYFNNLDFATSSGSFTVGANGTHPMLLSGNGVFRPNSTSGASQGSNYYNIGSTSYRWSGMYAYQFNNTSDRQDKTDIAYDVSRYADLFDRLKPVYFKFKNGDGSYHIGFIAQDVEDAANALGLELSDIGFLTKEYVDDRYYYALAYNEFIALCVEQIHALKAQNEQFEERLDEIEYRLSKLE